MEIENRVHQEAGDKDSHKLLYQISFHEIPGLYPAPVGGVNDYHPSRRKQSIKNSREQSVGGGIYFFCGWNHCTGIDYSFHQTNITEYPAVATNRVV